MNITTKRIRVARPEQARYVLGLKAKAEIAEATYLAALGAVLAGRTEAGDRIVKLHANGEVEIEMKDQAQDEGRSGDARNLTTLT